MKPLVKRLGYAVLVTMIGVYLFLQITGSRGVPKLFQNRAEIKELQRQNEGLRQENRRRREKIQEFKQDRDEQELEVRKRWKLQKKNSVDFYIPKQERINP